MRIIYTGMLLAWLLAIGAVNIDCADGAQKSSTRGKSPGELPDRRLIGRAKAAEILDLGPSQEADADLRAPSFAPLAKNTGLEGLSDTEVEARRLRFLEDRLQAGETAARAWQYGWTGIFSTNAIYNTLQAVTTSNSDDRVYGTVSAVKAALGVGDLWWRPLPARVGAAPMLTIPDGTPRGRVERLAVGEYQLRENADRAEERYNAGPHARTLAVSLLGGGVIWVLGNHTDAMVSALSGIAAGEAKIWSQPWRATNDFADYQQAFSSGQSSPLRSWDLQPGMNSINITFHF